MHLKEGVWQRMVESSTRDYQNRTGRVVEHPGLVRIQGSVLLDVLDVLVGQVLVEVVVLLLQVWLDGLVPFEEGGAPLLWMMGGWMDGIGRGPGT